MIFVDENGAARREAEETEMSRPLLDRPRDFRKRDPTKWLVAILVAAGAVAAIVAMNRYL
jgi:hypothetical protein